MGGQEEDNGLSLEGLARRLETLEHENERMRRENAKLRGDVAALSGSETSQAVEPAFEGRVSRRAGAAQQGRGGCRGRNGGRDATQSARSQSQPLQH